VIDPSEHASFVFNMLRHTHSDPNLTPAASRVAFWLTHHANRETRQCWPSIERLVQLTGLDKKTVRRAIYNLESEGYIEVEREHRKVNTYTLLEQDTFNMKRFVTRSKKSPQRRGKIPGAASKAADLRR
jgi:DNA-binding transcriptional MocR family regulator